MSLLTPNATLTAAPGQVFEFLSTWRNKTRSSKADDPLRASFLIILLNNSDSFPSLTAETTFEANFALAPIALARPAISPCMVLPGANLLADPYIMSDCELMQELSPLVCQHLLSDLVTSKLGQD